MNIAHLIGVHEAGIAHHVAAVRQVDGENRAASVLDGACSVIMETFVVMGWNITAGKILLDPFQELDVDRHEVFGKTMLRAILDHPDLTIALDDFGFHFTDFFVKKLCPLLLASDNRFPSFLHALGAERIRLARPTQGGLGLLPGLQQRLLRPLRCKRKCRVKPVEVLNGIERNAGG